MKIAILGAGFTGLSASFYLTKKGYKVFLFEKEALAGGLASGFKLPSWQWSLEKNYHHLFASDKSAFVLIKELGLENKLFFKKPITAVYYRPDRANPRQACQGRKIYPLDTPLNFLSFPPLSFGEKLKSGFALLYLKTIQSWKHLEKMSAKKWIEKNMGKRVWQILWEPLFINKFGKYANKVPASWFWARIKKRSRSLGYFEGGFQALADALVEKIKQLGGEIYFNMEVKKLVRKKNKWQLQTKNPNSKLRPARRQAGITNYDLVISTLPTPIFLKIAQQLPKNYLKRLSSIKHFAAQTLILELKKPFLENIYWLNICDKNFPFLLLVDHTNFIEPKHYGRNHLLYIGNYLPKDHPYLKKSKEELLKIFLPYLKKINPQFNSQLLITNYQLLISPFAQPVITTNYSQKLIPSTPPLPGLYLANQDMIYPWDRGINYAIKLGKEVATVVNSSLHTGV